VKYVARAASGRLYNKGRDAAQLPYRFQMDPKSIRKVMVSLDDLQRRHDATGMMTKNLIARGWKKIPDTAEMAVVFDEIWRGGMAV
jgi:hypothetical protein